MGKKKDTEIINEWILLEKTEKNRNHENRDGYMTNLSRNRYGEMEDVFGGTKGIGPYVPSRPLIKRSR